MARVYLVLKTFSLKCLINDGFEWHLELSKKSLKSSYYLSNLPTDTAVCTADKRHGITTANCELYYPQLEVLPLFLSCNVLFCKGSRSYPRLYLMLTEICFRISHKI